MCAFGLKTWSEANREEEMFAQKGTAFMTNAPHVAHALSRRCPNDGIWRRKDMRATRFRGPGATKVEPERLKRRITTNLETRKATEDVILSGDARFSWRMPLPGGKHNIETTYYYEPSAAERHQHQTLHSGRTAPAQQYTRELCRQICIGIQEQKKADELEHPHDGRNN